VFILLEDSLESKAILKRYIDMNGNIDFKAIQKDPWLKTQIQILEETSVNDLTKIEEFVFWLNSYNILTIKAVCDKLGENHLWKGNKSLFEKFKFFIWKKYKVGGKKVSLYTIENKILRKKFKEPRIHFVINCASKSCPIIPNRLFTVENIEEILNLQTKKFINDEMNVYFDESKKTLFLSQIFKWYKKDFNQVGGVIEFIRKYWQHSTELVSFLEKAKVKYLNYDWSLNTQ
ncbi:MAG: DUF547 domain-containing protein, partial [Candidatus Hodarchaeales archaeon]